MGGRAEDLPEAALIAQNAENLDQNSTSKSLENEIW